jgi:hypothetical protein
MRVDQTVCTTEVRFGSITCALGFSFVVGMDLGMTSYADIKGTMYCT